MILQKTPGFSQEKWGEAAADAPHRLESLVPRNLSLYGVALFVIGLAVFGSGYRAARLGVGETLVHPFLFVVGAIAPLVLLTRLHHFPTSTLFAFGGFLLTYVCSTFQATESGLTDTLKLGSSLFAIATIALAVRSQQDFALGTFGLMLGVAGMAFFALQEDPTGEGAIRNVLDSGNKNAYSLYALPAILLAGFVVVHQRETSLLIKAPLIVAAIISLLGIYTSANRSGYVCALLIAFMLFWRRKGMGLVVVLGVVISVGYVLNTYLGTQVLEHRLEETREGIKSDDLRVALGFSCLELGLNNPLLGVSPQELPWELGRRVGMEYFGWSNVDPHNVFGYVVAGSGVICFAAFIYIGWSLWMWNPHRVKKYQLSENFVNARKLIRMLLVLYIARGLFTREILYNPGFIIAMGLSIGWCIVNVGPRRIAEDLSAGEVA